MLIIPSVLFSWIILLASAMAGRRIHVGEGISLAYGSISFFTSLLHNVFLLYHVQVFISVYHIDKTTFWIGELAFLVWNSLNDPLFGWISDAKLLWIQSPTGLRATLLRRIRILGCAGLSLAATFLLFWYPWGIGVGLQFLVCLLLYDAFLTLVDLHHSALLAELTLDSNDRANLTTWSAAGSAIGASSVFLSYLTWREDDMTTFQHLCCGIALVSGVGFIISTLMLYYQILRPESIYASDLVDDEDKKQLTPKICHGSAVLHFSRQLIRHKNFMWFSFMHVLQVFHCHFNSNFFPMFLHTLLDKSVSPTVASLLMSLSFVLPHINNFYFLNACKRYGAYQVIRVLFFIKLTLSAVMIMTGYKFITLLCIFIASNRIFTEGTCKLLTLVVSDLVDEDMVLHNRPQPLSALIYGSSALLAKPGQTIAPLFGTFLLSFTTGRDIFQRNGDNTYITGQVSDSLRDACFHMLTFVSAGCAIIQLFAWTRFRLKDSKLHWVKQVRTNGADYLHLMNRII